MIAGLAEGLVLLREGESARFWVPSQLGYVDRADAPGGPLVFDVEVISVRNPLEAPARPEHVAVPHPLAQPPLIPEPGPAWPRTSGNRTSQGTVGAGQVWAFFRRRLWPISGKSGCFPTKVSPTRTLLPNKTKKET